MNIKSNLESVRASLIAHPDATVNSEFADRIDQLTEIIQMIDIESRSIQLLDDLKDILSKEYEKQLSYTSSESLIKMLHEKWIQEQKIFEFGDWPKISFDDWLTNEVKRTFRDDDDII